MTTRASRPARTASIPRSWPSRKAWNPKVLRSASRAGTTASPPEVAASTSKLSTSGHWTHSAGLQGPGPALHALAPVTGTPEYIRRGPDREKASSSRYAEHHESFIHETAEVEPRLRVGSPRHARPCRGRPHPRVDPRSREHPRAPAGPVPLAARRHPPHRRPEEARGRAGARASRPRVSREEARGGSRRHPGVLEVHDRRCGPEAARASALHLSEGRPPPREGRRPVRRLARSALAGEASRPHHEHRGR